MLPSEKATTVVADRKERYGHPLDVYTLATQMWDPTRPWMHAAPAESLAVLLICVKVAREIVGRGEFDNFVDICGYTNVWYMIQQEQALRRQEVSLHDLDR